MTVNLTGVTDAQALGVKISGVTDVFAQVLADTTLNADFLVGDTTGDGAVNVGDTFQTRNFGGQVTDSTNFRSDVNLDGSINSGDTTVVRGQFGPFHSIRHGHRADLIISASPPPAEAAKRGLTLTL